MALPLVKNRHVKVPLVPLPTSCCLVSKRYTYPRTRVLCSHCGSGATARPRGRNHRTRVGEWLPLPRGGFPARTTWRCPCRSEPRAAPRWLIRRRGVARAKLAPPPLSGAGARHTVVDCDGPFWHRAARWLRMAAGTAGRLLRHARGCVRCWRRAWCAGIPPTLREAASIGVVATAAYAAAGNVGRDDTRGEAAPIFNSWRPPRLPITYDDRVTVWGGESAVNAATTPPSCLLGQRQFLARSLLLRARAVVGRAHTGGGARIRCAREAATPPQQRGT